ncbi:hypothetical protein NIIDNTM18_25150 [Mycolicibacterium litorale]|uniref:Uncharacterized protein n=1 Tax=Mycolicibacterium litorale TaxID=758802 RepID=A0A6S6P756_9MYCO|nr:hypothetical protein NIIDNTM18_25150 [Mycolicibacterium litorale]
MVVADGIRSGRDVERVDRDDVAPVRTGRRQGALEGGMDPARGPDATGDGAENVTLTKRPVAREVW